MNEQIPAIPSSAPSNSDLPARPLLVLRLGFAGNRDLSDSECNHLENALKDTFKIIGRELVNIAPRTPVDSNAKLRISDFFSAKLPPLLRLITGLCEGADTVAGDVLKEVSGTLQSELGSEHLQTELAAVLPFKVDTYRQSRRKDFHDEFDEQLARCSWAQELDGIYDKPADTELDKLSHSAKKDRVDLANLRRARAYRAQGAFLLRHSDILIAATNLENQKNKAGGTMETILAALTFGLPVIFINIGKENNNVQLIDPSNLNANFDSVLAESAPSSEEYQAQLKALINQLTTGFGKPTQFHNKYDENLLREYFGFEKKTNKWYSWFREKCGEYFKMFKWLFQFREACWGIFRSFFRSGSSPESDPIYGFFKPYRKQATDLNYRYSDLYRGAFLSNYFMAIMAVILAAFSLALLTKDQPPLLLLFILGTLKLIIVIYILCNTKQANIGRWNEKAIDYRYLAERLRSMYYLPLAGSYRPPKTVPFASRKIRQSSVDWLFNALVRATSPVDLNLKHAKTTKISSNNESSTLTIITISPEDVATQVRDCWIGEQIKYHEGNAATMEGMNEFIEKTASKLNWAVIVIVIIDLFLIGGKLGHWFPECWESIAIASTPLLIMISVILPAIIAALSGIRSQAECKRLVERSKAMQTTLEKRDMNIADQTLNRIACDKKLAHSQPDYSRPHDTANSYLGSWSLDSLRLTEHVATSFSQEVSEWSVLYAKEVSDPG